MKEGTSNEATGQRASPSFLVDSLPYLLPTLLLLLATLAYCYNLTGWRLDDDEGTYLYGAWRVSLGEVIYRDFLTCVLPPFQYLAALLIRLFGPTLFPIRAFSVGLTLLAAVLMYALACRHYSGRVALIAMSLYLTHPLVYLLGRLYRPETYMMPLLIGGLFLFLEWGRRGRWPWLAASGAVLGLATFTRLFAALGALGCGLFLLAQLVGDAKCRGHWWRALLIFVVSYLLVCGVAALILYGITPQVVDAVLLHHLRPGSHRTWRRILTKGASFFLNYARTYPALTLGALVWAILRYRPDERARVWSWQLAASLAYLLTPRDLTPRYLMYLLPALVVLLAEEVERILNHRRLALSGLALLVLVVGPAIREDWMTARMRDSDTEAVVRYIQLHSKPGEYLLSDYPGLNFLAQRPSTPLGAGISAVSTKTGEITGHMLVEELDRYPVQLVALDISGYSHHTRLLPDFDWFLAQIEEQFLRLDELQWGKYRLAFYHRRPHVSPAQIPHPTQLILGDCIALLGYGLEPTRVSPGESIHLTLYWQARAPIIRDYTVFVHLLDGSGKLRSQADGMPWHNSFRTSRWPPGMLIPDEYELTVPGDAPPGEYRVTIGLYLWQTGERLPIRTADGDLLPDSRFFLEPSITVLGGAKSAGD